MEGLSVTRMFRASNREADGDQDVRCTCIVIFWSFM